jgi:hypothetical protein
MAFLALVRPRNRQGRLAEKKMLCGLRPSTSPSRTEGTAVVRHPHRAAHAGQRLRKAPCLLTRSSARTAKHIQNETVTLPELTVSQQGGAGGPVDCPHRNRAPAIKPIRSSAAQETVWVPERLR